MGLVEGHPLAVLFGLAFAGRERRQAFVAHGHAVPLAVVDDPLVQIFGSDPRTAASRAGGLVLAV